MDVNAAIIDILAITKRPEKAVSALRAINKVISLCTIKGEFYQDFKESTVSIDGDTYGDTIAIADWEMVRFRKFAYIKPTGERYYLSQLDANRLFDPAGNVQKDKYYLAGLNLTYTLSKLVSTLEIGYFQYAQRLDTSTNTSHWMLDIIPDMVTDLASAVIFKEIGEETSAKVYLDSGNDLYRAAKKDFQYGSMAVAQ